MLLKGLYKQNGFLVFEFGGPPNDCMGEGGKVGDEV